MASSRASAALISSWKLCQKLTRELSLFDGRTHRKRNLPFSGSDLFFFPSPREKKTDWNRRNGQGAILPSTPKPPLCILKPTAMKRKGQEFLSLERDRSEVLQHVSGLSKPARGWHNTLLHPRLSSSMQRIQTSAGELTQKLSFKDNLLRCLEVEVTFKIEHLRNLISQMDSPQVMPKKLSFGCRLHAQKSTRDISRELYSPGKDPQISA